MTKKVRRIVHCEATPEMIVGDIYKVAGESNETYKLFGYGGAYAKDRFEVVGDSNKENNKEDILDWKILANATRPKGACPCGIISPPCKYHPREFSPAPKMSE